MTILFIITTIIFLGLLAWMDHSYRKKLAKVKRDGYMEGWKQASETLSDFDINAWLDTKFKR